MNITAPLLDAALNGDPLAKCQVGDILEEYGLKRWPELKFEWIHGERNSICSTLGIIIYRSSPWDGRCYYSVNLNGYSIYERQSLKQRQY
jgi:hypothetical protein